MAQENKGHRARLRQRMIKEGIDGFQDHEVLEMLLFQYLPRKDTNKLAHTLLTKFGGFSRVLDATPDQLMMVNGISLTTACNLSMLKEVLVRYRRSQAQTVNLGSLESIIKYARKITEDNYCEKMVVVYVDHGTNYLYCDEFTSHRNDQVSVEVKQILSAAMRTNAAGVILFHCHVRGVCQPSKGDLEFTRQVHTALASVNIVLLEHMIFNDKNERYSFYAEGIINELNQNYKKTF